MNRRRRTHLVGAVLLALYAPTAVTASVSPAGAGSNPCEHTLPAIYWNDLEFSLPGTKVENWITYVPLRALTSALQPDWTVSWQDGQGIIEGTEADAPTFMFCPGETTFSCGEYKFSLSSPVLVEEERLLIPIRPLAAALGVEVDWNPQNGVTLSSEESDAVYWLSRIISAESRGESLEGQVAVGNVVLNRVSSPDFPNTIYGVIFEPDQFEPVRNGTLWDEPTESSILAARLSLAGVKTVAEDSLYFLAPELTDNHWTMENRDYVTTIGVHWFYR